MGLSFCPLHDLTWQKWFSMQSWFTIAGFITECGNFNNFTLIIELKPRHIACKSKWSFADMKFLSGTSALHFSMKERKSFKFLRRLSLTCLMLYLFEKRSITDDVCCRSVTAPSRNESSSPFLEISFWNSYQAMKI